MLVVSFTAEYHGECSDCGLEIKGKEVVYDGDNNLVHVTCPKDPATLQRDVCVSCWTELPVSGICGTCDG